MLKSLGESMRHPSGPDGRGRVVGPAVVLVLAFVAFAVLELLRTWHGAQHISTQLVATDDHTRGIAANTQQIALLRTTVERTGQIAAQTHPIGGQARRIRDDALSIRSGVATITADAGAIDSDAHTIAARAEDINTAAAQILDTAGAINTDVHGIAASAGQIQHNFAALLPVVEHIRDGRMPFGVNNIDRNTDAVIVLAREIVADLGDLIRLVPDVDAHARSICSAPLIRGPDCSTRVLRR